MIAGSYALVLLNPDVLKISTYVVLLPLILSQAAGLRRPVQSEHLIGVPVGAAVGVLYAVTTISGPPLALMLNNQGFVKEDFRAALGVIRVFESVLTATAYYFLGLYTMESFNLIPAIVPSVIVGLPIGVLVLRRMDSETFRRICMSFDAWIVGFGLSHAFISVGILASPTAYLVLAATAAIDTYLLWRFFGKRHTPPVTTILGSGKEAGQRPVQK